MKVVERVLEGQSNMGGERVTMAIDQSALAHIMSVLTDLYSDPELAVIREYATNAYDSHVEAGVKRPIEVTLPTPLSPFYRVRDYGVGLDAEGIREVYSQYGTSTKRNSNEVVGMLGLGCKSALTYSDQFTVTGYKDGRCIQVSVSRDEDGAGSMTIVTDHEHDGENGVEIIVPAKRHNAFEAKAHEFFRFWQPGTVLINGEQPSYVDGLWLDDNLLLMDGDSFGSTSYVVMGNVAYPIPDEHDPSPVNKSRYYTHYSHRTVAFVPIGDVQFTPSREALQMTKLTKDTLARIKAEVQAKLLASVQKQIEGAPTAAEALRVFKEARKLGISSGLTYQGREVMDSFERTGDPRADNKVGFLVAGSESYRRKSGERHLKVPLSAQYDRETVWFENFDHVELSSPMRERLRAYASQKGLKMDNARLVLTDSYSADERFWLDGQTIHDWTDVAAIKLESKNRTLESGRPRGSYKGYKDGVWSDKIVADTIDTSKPIFYVRGNRYSIRVEPEWRLGLIDKDSGTVLAMEQNRIDKFKRDFPQAKSFCEYGQEQAKKFVDGIDPEVREAALLQALGQSITRLKSLDPDRVDDPAMKLAIERARKNVKATLDKIQQYGRWLGVHALNDGKMPVDPTEKYPLLPGYNITGSTAEHVYLYLNAAYAAEGSA